MTGGGTTRSKHGGTRSCQQVHLGDEMIDDGCDGHLAFAGDGRGETFHGRLETQQGGMQHRHMSHAVAAEKSGG